jgi:hypothetical protein
MIIEKHSTLARWESRGGKDWVELRQYAFGFWAVGNSSTSYLSNNIETALKTIEDRVKAGAFFYCRQKSAMRRIADCPPCAADTPPRPDCISIATH